MTSTSVSVAAVAAAPLSVASSSVTKAGAIAGAAHDLLLHLERGQRIDAPVLRTAMENAFGASDADGGWDWKTAYDACGVASAAPQSVRASYQPRTPALRGRVWPERV